jgi:hypothetical protein
MMQILQAKLGSIDITVSDLRFSQRRIRPSDIHILLAQRSFCERTFFEGRMPRVGREFTACRESPV